MVRGTRPVALVTGSGQRLGRAFARALADAGYDLVLHSLRSVRGAAALARQLQKTGTRAWVIKADLANPTAAGELVNQARAAAGRLDLVVNNAALYPANRELDQRDRTAIVALNLRAPLQIARSFAATESGCVINILDARAAEADRRRPHYLSSKRRLTAATRRLARELAPKVRVNGLAPGLVLPPPGAPRILSTRARQATVLGTLPTIRELCDGLIFLARNGNVTGQVLFVDGGRWLGRRTTKRGR